MSRITDFNQAECYDPEQLLVETVRAESAGVFCKSSVDPVALLTPIDVGVGSETSAKIGVRTGAGIGAGIGGSRRWLSAARMVAPLAACLVIWLGIRSVMDTSELANPVARSNVSNVGPAAADGAADCKGLTLSQLSDCLINPKSGPLTGYCACADADQDGDFDLADFGHLQRSF